jgi:hypothetical protein
MAKAPHKEASGAEPDGPTIKVRVKRPITEAGTNFVPGVTYMVKSSVYEKIKAAAEKE